MRRGVCIGAFSPTTPLKIEKKGKLRDKKNRKLTWERVCISILFLYSRTMTPVRLRNKVKLQLYYVGVQWIRNLRYYDFKKSQVQQF